MIDTCSIRCSILQLAFRGKLTEQREADGNARDLLSRISQNKNVEQTENTPYEIPPTWAWVKLADLFEINPKVVADESTMAAFVPMERISAGFDRTFSFERQKWAQASKNHTKFSDGDVAFAKISPCFENRKSFIAQNLPNGIGGGTTELIVLRQREVLSEYTYYLLLDQRFISIGKTSYKGTVGQQRVQSDVIKNFLVPVPPFLEQRRIVERLEQAFSTLDTIDALQAQYADNLTVLKSKLIDTAIQGKLTEQLPDDGMAEELYRQIQGAKQSLLNSGKIKKEKLLPEITADEIPFEIPHSWKWVRLGSICSITTGKRDANFGSPDGEYYFFTCAKEPIRCNSYSFCGESLLLAGNGDFGNIKYYDGEFEAYQRTYVLQPYIEHSYLKYLLYHLKGNWVAYNNNMTFGATIPFIRLGNVQNYLVALPPLAEQKRIIEKLEELLPLCHESRSPSRQ